MVDLDQFIKIRLSGNNVNHYKNKGYDIDSLKRKDKKGRMTIPINSTILVKIKDLPESCNSKINIKCDYYGSIVERRYNDYKKKLSVIKKRLLC